MSHSLWNLFKKMKVTANCWTFHLTVAANCWTGWRDCPGFRSESRFQNQRGISAGRFVFMRKKRRAASCRSLILQKRTAQPWSAPWAAMAQCLGSFCSQRDCEAEVWNQCLGWSCGCLECPPKIIAFPCTLCYFSNKEYSKFILCIFFSLIATVNNLFLLFSLFSPVSIF